MSDVTIQQLMDALPQFFVPERAAGMDHTVQFNLAGAGGGEWAVHIHDQKLDVRRGTIPNPDLALSGKAQDVLDMFSGKLDPMKAYMLGRVRMSGSMSLAMKISKLFDVDLNKLRSIGQ